MKERMKEFNKLILLGNGFDLAHGLKTKYLDFIEWYVDICLKNFYEHKVHEDDNVRLVHTLNHNHNNSAGYSASGSIFHKNNTIKDLYVKFINKFLARISHSFQQKKWVDIEQEFYNEFKRISVKALGAGHQGSAIEELIKLNTELEQVSKLLKSYLLDNIHFSNQQLLNGFEYFFEELSDDDLIINFNYTNTINEYFTFGRSTQHLDKIVTIHGNVGDKNYPLVFGFGDERDEMYQKIEDLNDNRLLDHFKSFAYFRNQNYSRLLTFLDSGAFEVHTLGLSCGLSDRTLLSQIFEHDN